MNDRGKIDSGAKKSALPSLPRLNFTVAAMIYPRWLQALARADFLRSVGLYVTRDYLFLVRLRKEFLRLSVLEQQAREIEHKEDGLQHRHALSEAIRSLLAHFNAANDSLYLCLSPDQTISRQVFLPQAAEENLPRVLEYEMERLLPFRREEVYYDFLPTGRKGDKVGVLLFAVPKRKIDEILEILSAFGIKPDGVEFTSTALTNYLLFSTPGVTGPAVLLGGETHSWEMIGLQLAGGRVPEILFTHCLPQAEWIQGPGKELFQTSARHSSRLFGWGSAEDFISTVNGDSFRVQDLLELGKARFAGDNPIGHSLFIPAVGAALNGLREATLSVNLLPGGAAQRATKTVTGLNALLAAILLIGLTAWSGSYPIKDELRLRQLQKENEKIAPSVATLQREDEDLFKLSKELSLLSGLRDRRGEILHILDELSRILPSSAYLANFRYRDGIIELQGNAENASNLVPLLERSPVFKNVGFNAPSNRGRDNRETFSFKAELEQPQKTKNP